MVLVVPVVVPAVPAVAAAVAFALAVVLAALAGDLCLSPVILKDILGTPGEDTHLAL